LVVDGSATSAVDGMSPVIWREIRPTEEFEREAKIDMYIG
jgi:hypothetical protein